MSVQNVKIKKIGRRVIRLRQREAKEERSWMRVLDGAQRWFWMLYHEFLRDDVMIRAQSLAFLMIFSLLPLLAGAFFIFTFLAQFGMVQDALAQLTENFLSTIPPVHREFINEYILQFRDAYLANIAKTSSSVGIFALFILAWVGLQTFNNIDSTLNFIWSAERSRPFYEKVRNFIVVAVMAPIVLTGGFSVPIILHRIPVTRYLFDRLPLLGVLLNYVVPSVLVMGIFLVMYRYVPVRRVWWRSAFWGALFATVSLALTNVVMRIYFAVGTNSAYGKAAAVPLIGFWIYLLWIVIILGAEVSFLVQNGKDVFAVTRPDKTVGEGHGLLAALAELYRAHQMGTGPVAFEKLRDLGELDSTRARAVVNYLVEEGLILETLDRGDGGGGSYVLAREVGSLDIESLLEAYFRPAGPPVAAVDKIWRKSLTHWFGFFEKTRVADLAKER